MKEIKINQLNYSKIAYNRYFMKQSIDNAKGVF